MTIYEAVQLILQTYNMSKGGEVFLLDMGKPIKIIDIAEKMVRLSGLSLIDKNNPNGEIKILITGLRPGEKLYEELLISDKSVPSENTNIFYANEEFIELDELNNMSAIIKKSIDEFNLDKTVSILEQYVSGFKYNN
jgi:FlaA1/EpsC-like NDP-sugar epimerase